MAKDDETEEDNADVSPEAAAPGGEQPAAGESATNPPLAGQPAAGPRMSRRQVRTLRRELLSRLPELPYEGWVVGDQLSVAEEIGNLVDLGADAILSPLEPLAENNL